MKKLLLNNLAGCVLALAAVSGLYAQGGKSFQPTSFNKSLFVSSYFASVESELHPFFTAGSFNAPADLSANKFTAKAEKSFNKDFAGASPIWSESNDGYTATFTKNGIQSRVNYNKKGKWHSTIRYYGESELPQDVRHIVKSTYYDFSIFGVTEVSVEDKSAYIVVLEDSRNFIRVKVLDGEMTTLETLAKTK
jgi:hypothetical protein